MKQSIITSVLILVSLLVIAITFKCEAKNQSCCVKTIEGVICMDCAR